jgi:hypothetical protein
MIRLNSSILTGPLYALYLEPRPTDRPVSKEQLTLFQGLLSYFRRKHHVRQGSSELRIT